MLKFSKPGFNRELPDVKDEVRKAEEKRPNFDICWIIEKATEFQKNLLLFY